MLDLPEGTFWWDDVICIYMLHICWLYIVDVIGQGCGSDTTRIAFSKHEFSAPQLSRVENSTSSFGPFVSICIHLFKSQMPFSKFVSMRKNQSFFSFETHRLIDFFSATFIYLDLPSNSGCRLQWLEEAAFYASSLLSLLQTRWDNGWVWPTGSICAHDLIICIYIYCVISTACYLTTSTHCWQPSWIWIRLANILYYIHYIYIYILIVFY